PFVSSLLGSGCRRSALAEAVVPGMVGLGGRAVRGGEAGRGSVLAVLAGEAVEGPEGLLVGEGAARHDEGRDGGQVQKDMTPGTTDLLDGTPAQQPVRLTGGVVHAFGINSHALAAQ